MEIGKAFTFVTEDESWIKKLAIGAVFVLIPFLIFLLIGYQILIIRNVIDGKDNALPEWDEFGQLFIDGLIMVVTVFVYALPMILLIICSAAVGAATSDSSGMSGGAIVGVSLLSCLAVLLGIALAFITPALYIQYARTGEFGSMFQFGEVIAVTRENLVDILIVILVSMVANIAVSLVSTIAVITICGPIIVSLAGTAWIMFATGHLYGQIGRKMSDKALEPEYTPA